ncbi:hypothetical protein Q7P35_005317 [Cladosporium inversicolor]
MNLLATLPLAFALFSLVLALPTTTEPTTDVDYHIFPELAGFDNLEQLVGNDTESDIEERDPAAAASPCTLAKIKKLMFGSSMAEFQSARNAKSPSCFDWYYNKCTLSPDRPLGFNFIPPCQRHDFGDTNFSKKKQWNPVNKARTDWKFRTDMWAVCDRLTGWKNVLKRATCMVVANKYADAVVVFNPATDL